MFEKIKNSKNKTKWLVLLVILGGAVAGGITAGVINYQPKNQNSVFVVTNRNSELVLNKFTSDVKTPEPLDNSPKLVFGDQQDNKLADFYEYNVPEDNGLGATFVGLRSSVSLGSYAGSDFKFSAENSASSISIIPIPVNENGEPAIPPDRLPSSENLTFENTVTAYQTVQFTLDGTTKTAGALFFPIEEIQSKNGDKNVAFNYFMVIDVANPQGNTNLTLEDYPIAVLVSN